MKLRRMNLTVIAVFWFSAAFGNDCALYPAAPRTISTTAEQYASSGKFSLDDEEILVFDYGEAYDGLGKFRNPYFISNYANALYRDYLAGDCVDASLKEKFLKQADYLIRSADHENGMALWRYPFRNNHFDLPAGWISGIGQARIASVLWRAYGLTDDDNYKKVASAGMEVFKHNLKEGGVVTVDDEVTWIEEAPNLDGVHYGILNGHITALAGIGDFGVISSDPQWDTLVHRAIMAVKRDLPKFDAGFTSFYSLSQPGSDRILAPRRDYNSLHVEQLLWLFDETGDTDFLVWASRFQAYEVNGFRYSAKGSTNPSSHGPDQAAALYGGHYWSHNEFPTWIQVDLLERKLVDGIWVDGNGERASPRSFSVAIFASDGWKTMAEVHDNSETRRVIRWNAPVETDRVRLTIYTDNGNNNVALQAFAPLLTEPEYAPITNFCNHRTGNIDAAMDGDPDSRMKIYCPGWLIVPNSRDARFMRVLVDMEHAATISVEYSMSMDNWQKIGNFSASELREVRLPTAGFFRLSFDESVKAIHDIKLQ